MKNKPVAGSAAEALVARTAQGVECADHKQPRQSRQEQLDKPAKAALSNSCDATHKPRAVSVTNQTEVAALLAAGKYREGVPLWKQNGDTLLVGEIDVLKTWREKRNAI